MKYETRTTKVTVAPVGEPILSEMATHVSIQDDAAGEFVEVFQSNDDGEVKMKIYHEEWPHIRAAIDQMISNCKPTK